jgi:hypothetical protein
MRPAIVLPILLLLAAPATSARSATSDLHQVDFRGFTYYPSCADFESEEAKVPIKVSGGKFEGKAGTDQEGTHFEVREVLYGDLDGDGQDEALVRTLCNTGGTGQFDEGFVYGWRGGKPVLLGRIPGGDRASGGVRCARFENGALQIERLGNDSGAANGVDFVDTETWDLRGAGLAQVGQPVPRRFGAMGSAKPVRFAKGAASALIKGTASGIVEYELRAREGQTMSVQIHGKNVAFEIMLDDYTVACRGTSWSGELPGTGDYRISMIPTQGSASYELSVSIH